MPPVNYKRFYSSSAYGIQCKKVVIFWIPGEMKRVVGVPQVHEEVNDFERHVPTDAMHDEMLFAVVALEVAPV
jgi:hypothetical protein